MTYFSVSLSVVDEVISNFSVVKIYNWNSVFMSEAQTFNNCQNYKYQLLWLLQFGNKGKN